ncbi:hypothetical protein JHK85_057707 [Glycine max]|nr:hypothetical protein JHK85_057707 [Glycine max]
MEVNNWHKELKYDEWVPITVSGARPAARYKHAAAVVDEKLYIAGGSRNGRHLSDVQVARVGQSASLFGSRVILFGGEEMSRKLLNDVHVLDLESMTWEMIKTTVRPPITQVYTRKEKKNCRDLRHVCIDGGLEIVGIILTVIAESEESEIMEWSQPQTQGDLVSPRAGHTGITIDESWLIVGGGDNRSGCPETLVLDMSKLVWSVLTVVKQKDPLSSEGLSVCSATIGGEKYLLAFGGYNGRYSNEVCAVFVMRPKAKDTMRPKIFQSPAAAAAAASVTSAYALSKSEKLDFMQLDDINSKLSVNGHHKDDVVDKVEAIKEEKRLLELSIAEVRAENSKLGGEIEEINNTHAELTKELQSVQGQLVAERSRCFNLEAKIAELQKLLESMQSVEEEVQALREKKSALDQEMELAATAESKSSGWRWFGGSEK